MKTSVKKSVRLLLAALLVLAMLPVATLLPAAASTDVATVNGTGYDSIYDAIAAANAIPEGATVVLKAGAVETLTEKITVTGKVTIEGAN
ncbi:MAG: hypothetical protein E7620_03925, partial [Ruminococcaceae bacterium]|nr:hypothetical protein [Oscillospiraceae bacterium]